MIRRKQNRLSIAVALILMIGIIFPQGIFSYADEANSYSVTVENGIATDTHNGNSIANAKEGSKVYLLANDAPEGMIFDSWEVTSGNVKIYLSSPYDSKAYYDFIMPGANVSVRAKYRPIKSDKLDLVLNMNEASSSKNPILELAYGDMRTHVLDILRISGKLKFAGGSAGSGEIGYQEKYRTDNGIEISSLDYRYKRIVKYVQSGRASNSPEDDLQYTLTAEDYARFKAEGKTQYLEIRSVTLVFNKSTLSKRIAGIDRYETSLRVANELKASMNVDRFNAAVVANGDNYADALSGAYLAKINNAPLAIDYIKQNLSASKSNKVYLIGGKRVVPEYMRTRLDGDFTVKRIYGDDRFETNLAILKEANVNNEDILVCSGYGFADSLSASASGRPILLVGDSLSNEQMTFLKGISGRRYTIIGGYKTISGSIENWFKSMGNTVRVFGSDRYETSVAIAKYFFNGPKSVVLSYGDNFPDGLCGGVLAEKRGAPMILINENNLEYAREYVKANAIKDLLVLGGSRLITDNAISIIGD